MDRTLTIVVSIAVATLSTNYVLPVIFRVVERWRLPTRAEWRSLAKRRSLDAVLIGIGVLFFLLTSWLLP
jgi:hypothetical protein